MKLSIFSRDLIFIMIRFQFSLERAFDKRNLSQKTMQKSAASRRRFVEFIHKKCHTRVENNWFRLSWKRKKASWDLELQELCLIKRFETPIFWIKESTDNETWPTKPLAVLGIFFEFVWKQVDRKSRDSWNFSRRVTKNSGKMIIQNLSKANTTLSVILRRGRSPMKIALVYLIEKVKHSRHERRFHGRHFPCVSLSSTPHLFFTPFFRVTPRCRVRVAEFVGQGREAPIEVDIGLLILVRYLDRAKIFYKLAAFLFDWTLCLPLRVVENFFQLKFHSLGGCW